MLGSNVHPEGRLPASSWHWGQCATTLAQRGDWAGFSGRGSGVDVWGGLVLQAVTACNYPPPPPSSSFLFAVDSFDRSSFVRLGVLCTPRPSNINAHTHTHHELVVLAMVHDFPLDASEITNEKPAECTSLEVCCVLDTARVAGEGEGVRGGCSSGAAVPRAGPG